MTTEYRRGIPSVAHVEAATRLGLEWEDSDRGSMKSRWRLALRERDGRILSDSATAGTRFSNWSRPIRTDGTPVDWEVLDAEVARALGPVVGTVLGVNANGTVQVRLNLDGTVSPVAPEPRSFADVRPDRHAHKRWRLFGDGCGDMGCLLEVNGRGDRYRTPSNTTWFDWLRIDAVWLDRTVIPTDEQGNPVSWESIAQPTSAPPATVTPTAPAAPTTQPRGFRADLWHRLRTYLTMAAHSGIGLNDVVVLDTQRFEIQSPFFSGAVTWPVGRNHLPILNRWAVYQELKPLYDIVDGAQGEVAMPRDVEAEWNNTNPISPRVVQDTRLCRDDTGLYAQSTSSLVLSVRNFAAILDAVAEQRVGTNAPTFNGMPIPLTAEPTTQGTWARQSEGRTLRQQPTQPTPLPRFTADELDDVDHSTTTTQDSATLKRGKLPTVEAIGKYREVMAKRNGTVAEAVKASSIDCEVAQYVLERWAGGLSDGETLTLLKRIPVAVRHGQKPTKADIDAHAQASAAKHRPTLDTSEPVDTEAQRQRAEAKERQARMAAVQAQLAAERAARIAEPQEEPTRFSLLEVDETADPARSIEAWKTQRESLARHAQRKAIEYANRPLPPPAPAPKRKPFDVIDAQADGLSGSAALAVLLGRAMNAEC